MKRWIPRTCPRCGLANAHKNHGGSRYCRLVEDTKLLFGLGLVPYPRGNSLPDDLPKLEAKTVGEYGLEKVGRLGSSKEGERQFWVPRWVRCVTESFYELLVEKPPGVVEKRLRDAAIARALAEPAVAENIEALWHLGGEDAVRGFCYGLSSER